MTENRGGPALAGPHLYVGIDIGRRAHLIAAVPEERMEDGTWERATVRKFGTSGEGFADLVGWLNDLSSEATVVRVAVEPSGGWYARTVVSWLERHGYTVDWLQNWAVHDRRHLLIGKQAKTDVIDARLIARLAYERERLGMRGGFLTRPPQTADALRILVRNRLKLVALAMRYRMQLGAVEDVIFPELKDVFKTSTTGLAGRSIMEHFPTPERLAAADPSDVRAVIVKVARARSVAGRVPRLQALAAHSAGLIGSELHGVLATQRWLLEQLRQVEAEIARSEHAIAEALELWPEGDRRVLGSFPCVTTLRQAVLLSCIGDIASFRSDRQLRKLLGWYPEAMESGSSLSRHRLGRSGNRLGRREIWLWVMVLLNPGAPPTPFRDYYRRLRNRQMPGRVAIGHVASKLITVLYHCLKNGQEYDATRQHRQYADLDDVSGRV